MQRYRDRGLTNLATSSTLAVFYLILIPWLGRTIWPEILLGMEKYDIPEWKIVFYFVGLWNLMVFILVNIFFYVVYTIEHPFFEHYRIQKDEKWPWNADPAAWSELLTKTL